MLSLGGSVVELLPIFLKGVDTMIKLNKNNVQEAEDKLNKALPRPIAINDFHLFDVSRIEMRIAGSAEMVNDKIVRGKAVEFKILFGKGHIETMVFLAQQECVMDIDNCLITIAITERK